MSHELLIDKKSGRTYLCEPEMTRPGTHLSSVGRRGSALKAYFDREDTSMGV
ncbi:MAG: hypothetical protein KC609_10015 [Myxococcales bacterium]|nr:hypothetical protein [Myxococcales bacterium]